MGGRALLFGWIYFALNMVALFILGEGGSPCVQGKTLLFEDGSRWELQFHAGAAIISDRGESFVESVFHCDAGV